MNSLARPNHAKVPVMSRYKLTLLLSLASLTACATSTPPPPATLTYSPSVTCSAQFDLTQAISLESEAPTAKNKKMSELNETSACMDDGEVQSPYALFKLPTATNLASVQAGAILDPNRVAAPRIVFLDGGGRTVRSIKSEDLRRRGNSLSVLVRPENNESYVAILIDTASIGDHFSYVTNPEPDSDSAESSSFTTPYSYYGRTFAKVFYSDPDA